MGKLIIPRGSPRWMRDEHAWISILPAVLGVDTSHLGATPYSPWEMGKWSLLHALALSLRNPCLGFPCFPAHSLLTPWLLFLQIFCPKAPVLASTFKRNQTEPDLPERMQLNRAPAITLSWRVVARQTWIQISVLPITSCMYIDKLSFLEQVVIRNHQRLLIK